MDQKLEFETKENSIELYELAKILIEKCAKIRPFLEEEKGIFTFNKFPIEELQKGFLELKNLDLINTSKNLFVKPSLFSFFLSYSSITGYYNPFTFEAQVNFDLPKTNVLFTSSHEMAHQVGIAREDEANFVGFLASVLSKNLACQYSAYYNAFKYILNDLILEEKLKKKLIPLLFSALKKDLEFERVFYLKHKSVLFKVTRYFNDLFLKFNGQKSGVRTYSYFVKLLMGQYRKEKEKKSFIKVFLK